MKSSRRRQFLRHYRLFTVMLRAVLLLQLPFAPSGRGAPGDLEATFGTDGSVIINTGPESKARAVAIQPDGKLLVAGRGDYSKFVLVRYHANGILDTSFNGTG